MEVSVQCHISPVVGQTRAIHVPGYDKLPEGKLAPISRLAFTMTPAEKARHKMELDQARRFQVILREIQDSSRDFGDSAKRILKTCARASPP